MGGKSERFIMRLDGETLDRWKVRASIASSSVAALIIQSMEGQAPGPSADDLSQAAQQILATKDARIAELEKLIGERRIIVAGGQARGKTAAIATLRADPAMKAVEPTSDGKSLLPATLPVLTKFPPRQTYLRGQAPTKGKKP
jgi:hypothetical protein